MGSVTVARMAFVYLSVVACALAGWVILIAAGITLYRWLA
jgi:hypothetical protein